MRGPLVVAVAKVLWVNGQTTEETIAAAERLSRALGLRAAVVARWGDLHLATDPSDGLHEMEVAASPVGVQMERVTAAMQLVEDVAARRLSVAEAVATIAEIAHMPPVRTWLFALAAATAALALAVIFGLRQFPAAALIFASAGAGACLRRALAGASTNLFVQPFCAALFAGALAGAAARYGVDESLPLLAVCPCMVLVPGPHFLNGVLDLTQGRMALGGARLLYAALIVLAISLGLLAGLSLLGVALESGPPVAAVPLWQDMVAAGVAVAAFSVCFSNPRRMLPWPVCVGMVAHGLRWTATTVLHFPVAAGALVACVAVALVLAPVARRKHMPFAAIGFASVVSLMPGAYMFGTYGGLLQIGMGAQAPQLLAATIANGLVAATVILAMSLGLIVPKIMIDRLAALRKERRG